MPNQVINLKGQLLIAPLDARETILPQCAPLNYSVAPFTNYELSKQEPLKAVLLVFSTELKCCNAVVFLEFVVLQIVKTLLPTLQYIDSVGIHC